MMRPKARLAENSDGPMVRALLIAQSQFDESVSFDNINPYWLVAEFEDRGIVGCIQTLPSRPIGHLEMLATDSDLTDAERGLVVRELVMAGSAILYHNGATRIAGFVPFELKGYKRALKKRGAVVVDTGNMMLRRIA